MIDPGFGFAKNAGQNLKLLNELYQLNAMVIRFFLHSHVSVLLEKL